MRKTIDDECDAHKQCCSRQHFNKTRFYIEHKKGWKPPISPETGGDVEYLELDHSAKIVVFGTTLVPLIKCYVLLYSPICLV